ncbi:LysR substrate-binding domain-containing protein [Saprospiraceae bacterium]|nr:LysR substrate-binding domain-containing protein [Saprospiraceae bacterium]
MNYKQLNYTITIWREKSFSKAAKKMKISQPAISQQLINLEEYLGFVIFDRQSNPLIPTQRGLAFLLEAEKLNLQFKQLNEYGLSLENNQQGDLILGIIPTISSFLISLFINDFREKHPDINLSIVEMKTEGIVEGLLDRTIHAGIIATPIKSRVKFSKSVLFYEKFQIFCSEEHPFFELDEIALQKPHYKDLWVLREGNCFSNQVINICNLDKFYNQNLQYACDSIDALMRVVNHCGGFTFIPELATLDMSEEEELKLRVIKGKESVREISMIYIKNEPNAPLLELISKSIRGNLPKRMLTKDNKRVVPTDVDL